MELIEQHHPWDMLNNMALIIIDQTYTAALDIVGRRGAREDGAVVELNRPVVVDDPDSPVLTVHASATHCCVAFNTPRGGSAEFKRYTSPKGKAWTGYALAGASITVSPGAMNLARVDGGGRKDYWSCADVRPDVATGRGALAIVDTIAMRLDAAIRLEEALLGKANESKCWSPRVGEIVAVHAELREMRKEMDIDAAMRRRLHKRRRVEEITCRPAAAMDQDHDDETEVLMKRLRTLTVG